MVVDRNRYRRSRLRGRFDATALRRLTERGGNAAPLDQDGRTPLRRLTISFSQGAEWKALISKYIGTIPLSGDALAAEHNAIRRSATKNRRQQRHDREGRRGRER